MGILLLIILSRPLFQLNLLLLSRVRSIQFSIRSFRQKSNVNIIGKLHLSLFFREINKLYTLILSWRIRFIHSPIFWVADPREFFYHACLRDMHIRYALRRNKFSEKLSISSLRIQHTIPKVQWISVKVNNCFIFFFLLMFLMSPGP